MRVLRRRPGEKFEAADIPNTLKALQGQVGGPIEAVAITDRTTLIVNENGKLEGLPYNCDICGHRLVGTVLAVWVDGEDFVDNRSDPWFMECLCKEAET